MTTYNLAVYSALYGPIAIEKADSKEDLLKKLSTTLTNIGLTQLNRL